MAKQICTYIYLIFIKMVNVYDNLKTLRTRISFSKSKQKSRSERFSS